MQQASSVSMVNCRKHWLYNHSMCSLSLWSGQNLLFTQHKHICIWSSSLSVFHLHCPALMSVAALRVLVQQLFNPSPLNIWTSSHIPHRLLLTSCELYMWLVLRVIYESCWNCFLNTGTAGSFQYQAGPVTKLCNVQSYHCTLLVNTVLLKKNFTAKPSFYWHSVLLNQALNLQENTGHPSKVWVGCGVFKFITVWNSGKSI